MRGKGGLVCMLIIDDVRFEDEAAWVRGRGGLVLHLRRPGFAVDPDVPSERGIAHCEGEPIVANDGTLEQLRHKIYGALLDVMRAKDLRPYG